MVLVTIRMAMPPAKQSEALRILRSLAEMNKVHLECERCGIYQDIPDRNVLIFEERWRSEEALEEHLRSDEFRNLLLILDGAAKQPEIRFDVITSSTGIETIERARRAAR